MDKLSNQTKNLMKLTQELLVSEDDAVLMITSLSIRLVERLMRPTGHSVLIELLM